ncbi:hypothetical protein Pelo_9166 [Pelomyxa schiedti]|nr:hypothetical protein Pelo_9166 [Pelomyxa schiedti]
MDDVKMLKLDTATEPNLEPRSVSRLNEDYDVPLRPSNTPSAHYLPPPTCERWPASVRELLGDYRAGMFRWDVMRSALEKGDSEEDAFLMALERTLNPAATHPKYEDWLNVPLGKGVPHTPLLQM